MRNKHLQIASDYCADFRRRHDERRAAFRAPLHLRAALVYHRVIGGQSRPTYHGRTHDISITGLSLVVDHNVFTEDEVSILLAVPAIAHGLPDQIIEINARMIYTVFSSEHDAFRIGLAFRRFKRNGKQHLRQLLERHHFPVGRF